MPEWLPVGLRDKLADAAAGSVGVMGIDNEKSPCLGCTIHLDKLDKLNPAYPCQTCVKRMAYADRNYGPPARDQEQDACWLHEDGIDIFNIFSDGLKITDWGGEI